MRKFLCYIFVFALIGSSFYSFSDGDKEIEKVQLQFVDNLNGDFSFTSNWSYAENIFISQPHGELVCDGWCPEEVESMRLQDGRIDPKQRDTYYELVDTSHRFHSFQGNSDAYEYDDCHFIRCERKDENQFELISEVGVSIHSSLIIRINNQKCEPLIHYNSIRNIPEKFYSCTGGWITISKDHFEKNIFRAQFHFTFWDPESEKELKWEGKIHTEILS